MEQRFDERRFGELMEESQDLQSDAMQTAHRDLGSYVEAAQEARFAERREPRRPMPGLVAAGALGALGVGALAFAGSAAASDKSLDVQALQTAAGLENLAVYTYGVALTLPFIKGNAVIKAFAQMTMKQHQDHGKAFNAAAKNLGGKAQTKTDPKYTPVVQKAATKIKGPLDVVALAITLEDIAAATYVKDVGLVSTGELRQLFGSVAGVESQHKAILLAVQALLKGGAPQLIAIPTNAAKLPAAAGSVGFPDAFFKTQTAVPASEGAVK